jgi:hypothetical protein
MESFHGSCQSEGSVLQVFRIGNLEQQLAEWQRWTEEFLEDGILPWQLTEIGKCTESS